MTKIRRGGFVLLTWKGDHSPRHVHVYRDGRLVVKWNLEQSTALTGSVNRKLRRILAELVAEGLL